MFDAFDKNDLLLSMMATVVGVGVDMEAAEKAFNATRGDFRAKFTAAVEARLASLAAPEVFIEVPEHPEELLKGDLEKLVRPAAVGFLRSYPTKDELLDQAARIRRRQDQRPAWIPRIDRDGNAIPVEGNSTDTVREPERPLAVTVLAEVGEVTIRLPAAEQERAELAMVPDGIGEWESALYALYGFGDENSPASTVTIDAAANEALVPDESRWWSTEPPQPVSAMKDPGVASELLATSATLGGRPVIDDTPEVYVAIADALLSAGDWRYSPQWRLETWAPGDDAATLAIARAAIAGWADDHRSGVIVYVYGGALHTREGLAGAPVPLHSYLLTVTRSADGTDTVDTVHRMIWSCPGEHWCHRSGCPDDVVVPDLAALLTPIVTAGHAAEAACDSGDGEWTESYEELYGDSDDGEGDTYPDQVLEHATAILSHAGWIELEETIWEGGLQQSLLRRGEHCLTAAYDPVTRQIQLVDGKAELDLTLQALGEDGVLIGDDTWESVDINEATLESWGADLLAAADDLLHGRIANLPQLTSPVQVTMLGLHPHADSTLRGPDAATLVEQQLDALFGKIGLLASHE